MRFLVAALVAAMLCGVPAATAAKAKPCKPATAKKCKKAKPKVAPKPKPVPAPAPAPAPSYTTTFHFATSVSDADKTEITNDTNAALAYYTSVGLPLESSVSVYAGTAAEVEQLSGRTGLGDFVGNGALGVFMVNTASSGWTSMSSTTRAHLVYHELFHVVQNAWYGHRGINTNPPSILPQGGPTWLIEGSADYMAAQGADPSFDSQAMNRARQTATPLSQGETYEEMDHANAPGDRMYGLGYAAVAQLVKVSGTAALKTYWTTLSSGKTWQQAFQTAFGVTPDAFYASFKP